MNFSDWFAARHPQISNSSANAVLKLAEGGATVPFIARYRKEETGGLDEVGIRAVIDDKESWDEIIKRQAFIVGEIDGQGKLSPELAAELRATFDLTRLEDLYLPFKQKRKTKATIAKEAGLEPLAAWLWDCAHGAIAPAAGETPESRAQVFVDSEKGVADAAAALAGAGEIVIERLADDAGLRQTVRTAFFEKGCVRTRKADKAKPNSRFENYFAYQEPVSELRKPLASHRYLAMRRGWVEEELVLSMGGALPAGDDAPTADPLLEQLGAVFEGAACPPAGASFAGAPLLRRAARMALRAYVVPAIENEVHKTLREIADEAAISVFAENVRKLLMAAPFGPKAVLGVDPGIRTGCKLAVIDGSGKYVGSGVLHLESPAGKANAAPVLADLVAKGGIAAVAVGNGTAGRETESFVRESLKIAGLGEVPVVMVSEAGASVYSASEVAREEFPELDVTIRGAISIARRLQDPLAELVKIDPKSIGVGQYQHDVSPSGLKKSLDTVIDSCVNQVGVNLNTASYHLLSHVSGIGPGLAKAIVERRAKDGLFRSRAQLLEVPRFSKRVFEQAAGFLRIPEGSNALDNTGVHPERYGVLEGLAARLGIAPEGLLGAGVKLVREAAELKTEVGAFTFEDIVAELEKPGRDPRAGFVAFSFRQDIHAVADLEPGMVCPGIVTNVTNFGAFVDIGVHQDGLVHISQLADRFVKDPREVVSPGDRVTVRVLEVKREKNQIALTMKMGTLKGFPNPPATDSAGQSPAPSTRFKAERPQGVAAGAPRAAEAPASKAASGGGKARFERPAAGGGSRPGDGGPGGKPAAPAPFNNPFAALDKFRRR